MKALTYNLQISDYYYDIKIFTDYVLEESKRFIKDYEDDILNFLKENSKFYKNNILRDEKFLKDELIFELLMIGVLWIIYSKKALNSNFEYHDLMKELFNFRSINFNQENLKNEVDEIRGYFGSMFYLDYSNHIFNNVLSLENFNKLISWLEVTGEFNHELKAIYAIYGYLTTQSEEYVEDILCQLVKFGKWFIKESKNQLGKYTANVNNYINNNFTSNINYEDMIFCNRRESEYHLNMFGAEIMNRLFRKEFCNRPRKAVLVPSCMKNNFNHCNAKEDRLGEVCKLCDNDCAIAKISKKGLNDGFETYIIPHESSAFANATKEDKEELGIIGISCALNLISGGWKAESLKIPPQCVILDYVGCANHWDDEGFPTNISFKELDKILK